jgi:ABC-type antimicrobial peptide transport system permease subunit
VADISAAFGMLALTLAAVGLYGILAYSVSRRTREIGIRIALGSGSMSIVSLLAREALLLISTGSLAGIGIAFGASRLLSRYLAGVSPLTPSILIACVGTMLAITIAAVIVPSVRACRIDPLTALRHE